MSFLPPLFFGGPILGPKNTQKTAYFFGCSKKYPFFANFNLPKVSKNPQKGVFCMSVRNILRAQNIPYAHKKSCHELSRAHLEHVVEDVTSKPVYMVFSTSKKTLHLL